MNRQEIISKIKEVEARLVLIKKGTPNYRDTLKHIYKLNEKLMFTKSALKTNKIQREVRK